MDFSTNGTGAGTGVHPSPSTTKAQLQPQQQAPMFTSFDYPSTTRVVTAPDPILPEHHPCFLEGIGFPNRTARISPPGGGVSDNSEGKVMHRSYQPNGIKDGSGMKTSGRNLMNTLVGGAFGGIPNGHQTASDALSGSAKRDRCANGSQDDPNAQVTFQELTTMHTKPMNFTVGGTQSTQETATSCRKRRSMSQNLYSAEYFSSESNQPGADEMIEAGQAPPPPNFCFSQENPPQRAAQMHGQPAPTPQSAPPKAEPSSHKRFHMDPPMMRRSPRLTQAPMQQQQQQYVASQKRRSMLRVGMLDPNNGRTLSVATIPPRRMAASTLYNSNPQQQHQSARRHQFVQRQYALRSYANMQGFDSSASPAPSPSNYFYDPTANRNQLTTNSTSNVAWDHVTRQRQLAIVDNHRWRLPESIPPSPPQPTSQSSQDQQTQQQPTPPVRKASLCGPRRQSIERSEVLTKPSPSTSSFDSMMGAMQRSKEFDFSLSGEFTDSSSITRLRPRKHARSGFDVEAKERDVTGRTDGGDSDSAESMISTNLRPEYLQPNQFGHFDEPFDSTWNGVKLTLVQQPELQHRARYLTEGSRGPIKNRNFDGYPTIQLTGWSGPATVHVFVANESSDPHLHLFYQVCLVSTKSNRGCSELVFGFTTVVQMPFTPNTEDRVMSVDSVGLVKLRNSDVERRMTTVMEERKRKKHQKQEEKFGCLSSISHPSPGASSTAAASTPIGVASTSAECSKPASLTMCDDLARRSIKPKSSSTRLVYRVLLLSPENKVEGVVQVISDPIRCTQIVGGPEITRMSIRESDTRSQPELFIIGKNFVRGTRVIFRQLAANNGLSSDSNDGDKLDVQWERDAEIEPPFFSQTHLICKVPEYNGPSLPLTSPLRVHVYIQTPNKVGRPETFTYLPTLPVRGPPTITRLSHREAPARGVVDLIILGTNFSPNCRVLFRQVVMATDVGGVFDPPDVYDETPSLVWQREARINTDDLTNNYLVCRVPPYDGQPSHLLTSLQVQIIVEGPGGSSAPETFYYVQCK